MGWVKHKKNKTLAAGALLGANMFTGKAQPLPEIKTENRMVRRMREKGRKKIT